MNEANTTISLRTVCCELSHVTYKFPMDIAPDKPPFGLFCACLFSVAAVAADDDTGFSCAAFAPSRR